MGIEPEVQKFLQRVLWSIFAGLIWLLTNITAGIFAGWLFFETRPTTGNIIYYIWLTFSLGGLIWIYLKLWKKHIS